MNHLVIAASRSGGTLLTDILSYTHNTLNLGECLHSLTRQYNHNNHLIVNDDHLKDLALSNLSDKYYNYNIKTRNVDYMGFFQGKQERINRVKGLSSPWTIKEQTERQTLDLDFIDYCCDNADVYITHRKDITSQYVSFLNAKYKSEILKYPDPAFIYTNNDSFVRPNEMKVGFSWLHMYTNVFICQLLAWRSLYDRYKSKAKIVSYEDNIKPMDFQSIGIEPSIIEKYKNEKQHLVPTPYNIRNVKVIDDIEPPTLSAWYQCLYYVERHKYLVEI